MDSLYCMAIGATVSPERSFHRQQTRGGGVSSRAIFKIALNFRNKRGFEGKHRLVQQTPKHEAGEHLRMLRSRIQGTAKQKYSFTW